ncbi:LOB domain-containing protein 24-like [Cornus florida]|uniref:LOB domain-containing protein 24-like n=1 Tax=Cornus florida TaxID=4283 RepID=UPI002899CF59|nr:LOB domain-containing protein 24-like [Cornus florida]
MTSTRCAACKYLRRRCPSDCIFSPYFPSNDPQRFACVHNYYGASNIAKMIKRVPVDLRGEVADSLHYEAQCRVRDPVYGCVGIIYSLQIQLAKAEAEVALLRAHQPPVYHHQVDDDQIIQPAPTFNCNFFPQENGVGHSQHDTNSHLWFP